MKWQLDLDAGALYVYLHEAPPARQREVDGVIADIDAGGRVVGLEVLSAWAPVDWHAVAAELELPEGDVVSIEFLAHNMLVGILAGRSTAGGVGTTTAEPARVLTPA